MALPTLASAAFACHVLVAGALHRKQHEGNFDANHEASFENDAHTWPSWPHFPRSGLWPHFPRSVWPWKTAKKDEHECGEDQCGLLAGQSAPSVSINCTDGEKWLAPTALFVRGREGANGIYCGVPKIGTTFMFSVMDNLGLSAADQGARFSGYRRVSDIVKDNQKGEIRKLCDAYSFVITRNPWDRIVSAYVDKVLTLDTTTYRMEFDDFMGRVKKVNASFLNLHFRPASVQCNTVGDHRHKYDRVIKLEESLDQEIADVFIKHLKIPEDKVQRALDAASTHSSSTGKVSERFKYDKSIDSDLDRTTYYFQQGDPEIVRRVYRDDIEFGKYELHS